ncbi:hypothetical protein HHI_05295 [Hyphomonas hirschiana VP5]|uniref:Uncharacterized protein n=1 Tax=Hyphomonas hirschiana VP5 TaxID=1280951 RepID=A0A059FXY8_9PROT|nr:MULTISPECIES: hypothetical protein [Hyphomonas]KCZ95545.1 hypothetical protein HHI_05295 [Hyphomonas hirschiana VP5]
MDIQTLLTPVTGLLPAAWSEDTRVLVVELGAGVIVFALMVLAARLFVGGRRKRAAVEAGHAPAASELTAAEPAAEGTPCARGPNLDPEEWVSGNVIHLDRYRAVGFIRCDRVKSPVRFAMPDLLEGAARAPRVGEKVRFKGRHGARRRPVADVVERAG